jgi:hypothetical protein
VGAVEDADHAAGRDLGVDAPEEVVAGFERGGHFKGGDIAALGIDAGEDVADGAVFACGIHALKNDEQGFCLACVEDILKVSEFFAMFNQDGFGGLFGFKVASVGGRYFGEPNIGVRLDEIRGLYLHSAMFVGSTLRQRVKSRLAKLLLLD